MFSKADIILICGSSSSGKSSIANMLCALDTSFFKLNTKKMNILSEQQISSIYFSKELKEASKVTGLQLVKINDIFIESKKTEQKALISIVQSVAKKLDDLGPEVYIDILYNNYFQEVQIILNQNFKCIVDHNIFQDPYSLRRDVFFKNFKSFGNRLKTICVYNKLGNVILNTLERNKRFYHFINLQGDSDTGKNGIDLSDKEKGFSHLVFRQPLRVIENVASMYNIKALRNNKVLETINNQDFSKLLEIAQYEQEKLIGFLLYKNYPFAHIPDEELLWLRSDFEYLNTIRDTKVYVQSKCFECDLQIIIDKNLTQGDVLKILKESSEGMVQFTKFHDPTILSEDINKLWLEVKAKKTAIVQKFNAHSLIEQWQCPFYTLKSFTDTHIIQELVDDIITRAGKRLVIYPLNQEISTVMLINNEKNFSIIFEQYAEKALSSKKLEYYDNNLVFLAKIFSWVKLKKKIYNLNLEFGFGNLIKKSVAKLNKSPGSV